MIEKLTCLRCGYVWYPRSEKLPKTCPNPACNSPYWNKPRTKGVITSAEPKKFDGIQYEYVAEGDAIDGWE